MSRIDLEIKKVFGSTQALSILKHCLNKALKIKSLKDPWAMVLSTGSGKKISSRVVLLKQLKNDKLLFYTNYLSQKGKDINHNPYAAINFYWPQLNWQIRIEGVVSKTQRRQSLRYWKSRNRESQISQWISQQSQAVISRQKLKELKKQTEKKFYKKPIPCPKYWGGYALKIHKIEFWRSRSYRLHDRFLFEKIQNGWKKQRLFP